MRGQIRKRGRSWALVVYLGNDPQTRKKRYKWYTYRTRRDAEAHLAHLLGQLHAGARIPPSRLRFGEFLDHWLRDDAARLEPTTERIYRYQVTRHIKPELGHIPIGAISAQSIEGCLARLRKQGLSPSTAHQTFRVLRTALRDAVRWGVLADNPCRFVSPPSVGDRDTAIWDEEQLRLFLAEAKRTSPYYAFYLTMALTGLREGEVLGLRWRDVDFAAGIIVARQKFYRMGKRQIFGRPKTKKAHSVTMPPVLADALRRVQDDQRGDRRVLGDRYEDRDLVFAQRNGRPLHVHNIARRDFHLITTRLKLLRIRLYDLRHCHGTYLADQGTPIREVQEQMGHSSPTVTLRYYVHSVPRTRREAVNRLADRILGRELGAENSRE